MTIGEILREGGSYQLRNGFVVYSVPAFRKTFKVGDLITFGTGRVVGRITAIGEKRFLFRVTRWNNDFQERVGTITAAHGWKPVKPERRA